MDHVDRAKRAMTDTVPTTRLPGTPLAEALHAFDEELLAATEEMPPWRIEEVEDVWGRCSSALEEARAEAGRLRLGREPPAGFEGLIGAIGDVLAPLDVFGEAADRFRGLGRKRR